MDTSADDAPPLAAPRTEFVKRLAEWALLLLLFVAFGCGQPPSVNEAHYLCKAKHFWNESWCHRDLFISSSDAHYLFYWSFGWLTLWLPLPVVAWIARIAGWMMLAAAWLQLSRKVLPRPWVGVLTGGMFAFLIRNGHMSGEWLIGGAEAKVFAYALALSALSSVIDNRWRIAAVAFGLAASFHILVGGWAIIATGMCWLAAGKDRPSWKRMLLQIGPLAMVCALPGLVPAIQLTLNSEGSVVAQANEIYVIERLPHHLVFTTFASSLVYRHLALSGLVLALSPFVLRHRPARLVIAFACGAMVISAVGILINQITLQLNQSQLAASLLRFYWFRLADVAVPMALAIGMPLVAGRLWGRHRPVVYVLATVCALVVLIDASKVLRIELSDAPPPAVRQSIGWTNQRSDEKNQEYQQWLAMCTWIRSNTDPDALFVTPRSQQTFKWYAHRAEVANWKDVPQDAAGMVQWWRRMDELYGAELLGMSVLNLTDDAVQELVSKYQIDYLVVHRRHLEMRLRHGVPAPYAMVYPSSNAGGRFAILDTRRVVEDTR